MWLRGVLLRHLLLRQVRRPHRAQRRFPVMWLGVAEKVELRRRAAGDAWGEAKPHVFDETCGLAVDRPAVDVNVVAVQTPHLLHDQRRASC